MPAVCPVPPLLHAPCALGSSGAPFGEELSILSRSEPTGASIGGRRDANSSSSLASSGVASLMGARSADGGGASGGAGGSSRVSEAAAAREMQNAAPAPSSALLPALVGWSRGDGASSRSSSGDSPARRMK